jgi:pimeloyl-ACP methyl ester carboxylesterase
MKITLSSDPAVVISIKWVDKKVLTAALVIVSCNACVAWSEVQKPAKRLNECVILLHGLARTASSMVNMQEALTLQGYDVLNVDYPSREYTVEELSTSVVAASVNECNARNVSRVHFVTHSLGGILVRYYLAHNTPDNLGRIVMLSPPNHGSEAVDTLKDLPPFQWLNGPAGLQLGTGPDGIAQKLPPANYELGVITGDQTINLILSTFIPGTDDGKVSIASAQLQGMRDFIVVHHAHPFIMNADDVLEQTLYFLRNGVFNHGRLADEH